MNKFNAAQPALLYLVPACLGASFIVALMNWNQYKLLLEYNEESEEGENEEDSKKDK